MGPPVPGSLDPGAMIADRFVVVRQLGAGGLGAVYEVEHRFTRHHRAMKVLHAKHHGDRDLVDRFLKEASAAGRIGDPHIVETFDAGLLPDGSPYVVMEYLQGQPLSEVLRRRGRLEVGQACAVLEQVCAAVQAAHAAGIVHRDLKPENLFLTRHDGEGFLKVLDFGVSKFSAEEGHERQTRSGITMGTPLYMPPEQLKDAKSADARSDVYSLGVILYELVTGQVPFAANSFAELAVKVLSAEVPTINPARADVPEALRAHLARALQKDPSHRFQTAADLRAAVLPFARTGGLAALLEAPAGTEPLGDTWQRDPAAGPDGLRATAPSPARLELATDTAAASSTDDATDMVRRSSAPPAAGAPAEGATTALTPEAERPANPGPARDARASPEPGALSSPRDPARDSRSSPELGAASLPGDPAHDLRSSLELGAACSPRDPARDSRPSPELGAASSARDPTRDSHSSPEFGAPSSSRDSRSSPELAAQLRHLAAAPRLSPPRPQRSRRLVTALVVGAVALLLGGAFAWRVLGPRSTGPMTVAVLPFDNTTGDPENDYLGEGLAEAVMYQLSRAGSLRVTPRASVVRAKATSRSPVEAGQALGVAVVLTGELGPRKLVRVELVDVRNDALLWGARWQLDEKDLLSVQREIAAGAKDALVPPTEEDTGGDLAGEPKPAKRGLAQVRDPEAFRLYLKGRYFWNKRTADGLEQAQAQFKQALELAPDFALAWVGLGDSLALLDQYAGIPSRENCPKARAAIDRALELDPSLAVAHASSGLLLGHCEFKWAEAEAAFQRSISLDPGYVTAHHWYALHLAYRGLFARARDEARRAQELDPLSLIASNASSVVNGAAGDWAAVLTRSDQLIAQDAAFPVAHMWRGRALRAQGDLVGAKASFEKAFELTGQRSSELMGELGATAAAAGDHEGARRWKQRLEEGLPKNPSGAMQLAMIAAALGERDDAFRWLEQAFEAQSWFLVQLKVEPLFAPLRDDPRFAALSARAGLR